MSFALLLAALVLAWSLGQQLKAVFEKRHDFALLRCVFVLGQCATFLARDEHGLLFFSLGLFVLTVVFGLLVRTNVLRRAPQRRSA